MPRPSKGPRLYLKPQAGRAPRWVIRDSGKEFPTGCSKDRLEDAEGKLAEYILTKRANAKREGPQDPAEIGVSDVLANYAAKRAPELADTASVAGWITHLNAFWGDRTLADVKRSTCQDYVANRITQPNSSYKNPEKAPRVSVETARRELETLSGAIGFWHEETPLTHRPSVCLPEKAEGSRDFLTRHQAAALLKAAMGWRKGKDGKWTRISGSGRANRDHLRRFILLGLFTGTRHSAITALLWHESATHAWVDLDAGILHRRGREEREKRNKKRPRVKLPRRLLAHLRRWKRLDDAKAAEEAHRQHNLPPSERDAPRYLAVVNHGGYPITGKIRRGFAGCVKDAGLSEEITPHWMRHTAATWLMQNGADIYEAAGFLGMTVKVLEDHYLHHHPDYQEGAARAIGRNRR